MCNIVIKGAGDWLPELMHLSERLVTLGLRLHHDNDSDDIR